MIWEQAAVFLFSFSFSFEYRNHLFRSLILVSPVMLVPGLRALRGRVASYMLPRLVRGRNVVDSIYKVDSYGHGFKSSLIRWRTVRLDVG